MIARAGRAKTAFVEVSPCTRLSERTRGRPRDTRRGSMSALGYIESLLSNEPSRTKVSWARRRSTSATCIRLGSRPIKTWTHRRSGTRGALLIARGSRQRWRTMTMKSEAICPLSPMVSGSPLHVARCPDCAGEKPTLCAWRDASSLLLFSSPFLSSSFFCAKGSLLVLLWWSSEELGVRYGVRRGSGWLRGVSRVVEDLVNPQELP